MAAGGGRGAAASPLAGRSTCAVGRPSGGAGVGPRGVTRRSGAARWLVPSMCGGLLASMVIAAYAPDVRAQAAVAEARLDVLVASLDSAARAHAEHPAVAGLSVAVVQGGRTLLEAGYGYVDLEWDVPTPADGGASYQIGSVTKQFTAAAVLLLAEEGGIDLDADLTRYVDFDTGGRHVPVRRLLDHTSGIRGYTEMDVFGELMVRDLPRDSLVRLVEREPFDFEPGTALIYNNSAYFLLGLILEEVTGQDYEEIVTERLFGPVGMTDSYYCSERDVRERRAHGYDAVSEDSLARAQYIDHTWPYSAGSLCSTVADLVRWNEALHGGRVLGESSYAAMTSPAPLVDGTPVRYAMGLVVDSAGGRRSIAHGGGIPGFLTDGRYYPDEELIVVVLQNSAGPAGPASLAGSLAELVLGPLTEPVAGTYSGPLEELAGRYVGPARGGPLTVEVGVADGALSAQPEGGPERTLAYREGLTWADGGLLVTFVREGARVVALRWDTGAGHYVLRRQEG